MGKHPTSMRLSDEAKRLIAILAERMAVSQSAVVEVAVRALARREGVK